MYIIAVKNGSAQLWETSVEIAAEEEGWNRESGESALDFLQVNCGFLIVEARDLMEVEEIATTYQGDSKYEIREKAWQILQENGIADEAKQRQIKSLCESGEITYNVDSGFLNITYSDGAHSYVSKFCKNEYDEWEVVDFTDDEASKMLDIQYDDDMVNYLIDCVKNYAAEC